jgi:hypothetical protein
MWLRPGGLLVFNAFVTDPRWTPDDAARQMGEVAWSSFFVAEEVEAARAGGAWSLVSDDDAYEVEKAGQPEWPPTGWFPTWSRGRDLFNTRRGRPPISLRWIVLRRNP